MHCEAGKLVGKSQAIPTIAFNLERLKLEMLKLKIPEELMFAESKKIVPDRYVMQAVPTFFFYFS